jgi:hypothetical protein
MDRSRRQSCHSISGAEYASSPEAGISPAEVPQLNSLMSSRATWPLTAGAQQPARPTTIGFLESPLSQPKANGPAFRKRQSTTTQADRCSH